MISLINIVQHTDCDIYRQTLRILLQHLAALKDTTVSNLASQNLSLFANAHDDFYIQNNVSFNMCNCEIRGAEGPRRIINTICNKLYDVRHTDGQSHGSVHRPKCEILLQHSGAVNLSDAFVFASASSSH